MKMKTSQSERGSYMVTKFFIPIRLIYVYRFVVNILNFNFEIIDVMSFV